MRLRTCVALFLSFWILSCGNHGKATRLLDLTHHLAYADIVPDSQVILFGTPEARPYLISGWSNPEKQGGEPFQWAMEQNPAFHFRTLRNGPLYLHLTTGSFYSNTAEVLVNHNSIGTLKVAKEADTTSMLIPESALARETNVVEFRFAELRAPANPGDTRRLAAAFYSAVITPSKYVEGSPSAHLKEGLWTVDPVVLSGKRRRAFTCKSGLSVFYHEKLSPGASLSFGVYFRPSAISEEDDFASFSVYLRLPGVQEKRIYYKHSTTSELSRAEISLASYMPPGHETISELEFRLERNSIFDADRAAWIDPVLTLDIPAPETQHEPVLETIRQSNRGANVVFMLLDAGGAKHFGCYGYSRNTTPVIDQLARDNIRFTQTYTNAVYTLASTSTLMSGLDPLHHRIISRKSRLPAETMTLAERFLSGGYSTGTFVANGNASGIFGLTQGFQEIDEVFRDPNYTGWAMDITNHFTAWLDKKQPRLPFFAYLHYREPHGPFNPPPEWKFKYTDPNYHGIAAQEDVRRAINFGEISYDQADKDYIEALYDANLNYADYEVGRVLKKLKDLGIYDNTIVIVTADHGEAFWEHNFQGHNSQLYEESVHIPFILKLTGRSNQHGRVVDGFVRTLDYYPTLVDLMNFSQRDMKGDGRSILPYLASAPDDGRPVITQTIMEQVYSYRDGDYKYLIRLSNRNEELYNLKTDPGETRNLIAVEPLYAHYFRARLTGWLAEGRRIGALQRGERAVLDENTKENLKALGYIDDDSPPPQPGGATPPEK